MLSEKKAFATRLVLTTCLVARSRAAGDLMMARSGKLIFQIWPMWSFGNDGMFRFVSMELEFFFYDDDNKQATQGVNKDSLSNPE